VQVMYNTRAKSYNFVPDSSIDSPQLQPWVEIELEDGQMLRTKLLVSNAPADERQKSFGKEVRKEAYSSLCYKHRTAT